MVAYKLVVRAMSAERTAAVVDFRAARDDLAITRSVSFAGVFPHELWDGTRLVHRRH
ncbi:MAG: hypothetical protein JWL96_2260 [Sphingomonas bacterium]|jgi:hypothetical protein|nr:hypothetical protein [Sphingomonas bacterium]